MTQQRCCVRVSCSGSWPATKKYACKTGSYLRWREGAAARQQVRAGFRTDVRQRRVSKRGHNVVVPSAAVVHVPSASGGDMAQDAPSEGYLRMQTGEGHEDALVPKQCMERDQREHTAHPTHSTSATYTASCHVGPTTKCERQWVGGSEMRCTRVVDGHATYRGPASGRGCGDRGGPQYSRRLGHNGWTDVQGPQQVYELNSNGEAHLVIIRQLQQPREGETWSQRAHIAKANSHEGQSIYINDKDSRRERTEAHTRTCVID